MEYSPKKLREYIDEKRISEGNFAAKIPINPNYLSQLLNGHRPITEQLIRKIKKTREYSDVEDFLLGINEPDSQYNKAKKLNHSVEELQDLLHEINLAMVKVSQKINQIQKLI